MTDPDTTPLRKIGESKSSLATVEAKTPEDFYTLSSSGLYGHGEYKDIALLLKKNILR